MVPVSYTHLVRFPPPQRIGDGPLAAVFAAVHTGHAAAVINFMRRRVDTRPVSYTHLDRFFGMRTDADTLKIYELKHLPPGIAAMADKCIDKFVKSDLKSEYPGLERSRYSFTEVMWIPTSVHSEGVCSAAYSISPCYDDFKRFVAGNRTQVSSGNHDLATLLYICLLYTSTTMPIL